MDTVQEFRAGSVTKIEAILKIRDTIPQSDDDQGRIRALGAYLRMLDSFEQYRDNAATRGGVRHDDGGGRGDGEDVFGDAQTLSPRAAKRPRNEPSDDGDEDDEESSPKRKPDESSFPRIKRQASTPNKLPASIQQTKTDLQNFAQDIKFARTSLLINSDNLPQFPQSEWTNLLTGQAVDLDNVLSGIYSISHDEKRTEKLGSFEIAIGTSAAKTVSTHGEWVIAWNATVAATSHIFPHRDSELREYGQHIMQFFASLPIASHQLVINYDRVVRIRVASRKNLLLTDHHEFADLQIAWIHAGGAAAQSGRRSATNSGTGQRREACRKWNAGVCRYAHVCAKCRSNKHVSGDCGKK